MKRLTKHPNTHGPSSASVGEPADTGPGADSTFAAAAVGNRHIAVVAGGSLGEGRSYSTHVSMHSRIPILKLFSNNQNIGFRVPKRLLESGVRLGT